MKLLLLAALVVTGILIVFIGFYAESTGISVTDIANALNPWNNPHISTCRELEGTTCTPSQDCYGSWLETSDTSRCCSGECAPQITTHDTLFFDFHYGLQQRNPELFSDHNLLDAVILQVGWPIIEPERGVFDFSGLDESIDLWSDAGKSIVLRVIPYCQSRGGDVTPDWIYDNVPKVIFETHKAGEWWNVTNPMVWDDSFLEVYGDFVEALAEHYDNDNRVRYIQAGIANIGFTTAQPSSAGTRAFVEAGWNLELWEDYINNIIELYESNFQNKKLIFTITPLFARDKEKYFLNNNFEMGKRIAKNASDRGYYILFKGIGTEEEFRNTGFIELSVYLASLNLPGFVILFGDDWPLYGQTGDKDDFRDEDDFEEIIDLVYSVYEESINKAYPISLVVLDSELAASDVNHKKFNQEVYDSLLEFVNKI